MVYGDGLFLLLAFLCLLALLAERWIVGGLAAAGAGFVRPNGLVLVVVCIWAAATAIHRDRSWVSDAAPILAPLGAGAYFLYLHVHTQDWFAFLKVEDRGWDNRFDFGAANIRKVFQHAASGRFTFFTAVLAVVVGGTALGLWLLISWRPPSVIVVYVLAIVAIALLTSKPTSVSRYLLAAAPLLIPIAQRLPRGTLAPIVAVSGVLMATLFFVVGLGHTLAP